MITTAGEGHAYGMTATAFSSVSLDPPLVLVCLAKTTEGSQRISENGIFAVNVLAAHQEPISRYFASKERPRGRDAFREIPHRLEVTGAPVIAEAASFVDCMVHAAHDAGDHVIFIGEVVALGVDPEVSPLIFHGSGYRFLG